MGNENTIEKAKQIINETSEFIKNIKLEEGKTPDQGVIVFKFDNGKILSPVIIGNHDMLKAQSILDFIIDDIKRSQKANQMPDDVKTALGLIK
jgi:hypothetical protein